MDRSPANRPPRAPRTLLAAAALVPLVLAACRPRGPAPTPGVDTTRTDGPPVTYEEIERGLTGRWHMVTPMERSGNFYPARELIFQPNRVWVSPSFRDYGGRYYLDDIDQIRLRHDPTSTELTWTFRLVGDTLFLSDASATAEYRRSRPGGPGMATGSPGAVPATQTSAPATAATP